MSQNLSTKLKLLARPDTKQGEATLKLNDFRNIILQMSLFGGLGAVCQQPLVVSVRFNASNLKVGVNV